jgi:hypothetical protein
MYGNTDLKRLYAEICDVEEEHVTMYETLISPLESPFEKWLIHEFCEACNYYNCYIDEKDSRMKLIWEEMLSMEIEHLKIAANMFEQYEKKDAISVIGEDVILPCHFESQKEYVKKIMDSEVNKRVDKDGTFNTVDKLPDDWDSYNIQKITGADGAPSEQAINLSKNSLARDIALADSLLLKKQPEILQKSMQNDGIAKNTITIEDYEKFSKINFEY